VPVGDTTKYRLLLRYFVVGFNLPRIKKC